MKKILVLLASVLFAVSAQATPQVQIKKQLTGLGMHPELASYLSGIASNAVVFNNGATIKVRNSGDTSSVTAATLSSTAVTLGAQDVIFGTAGNYVGYGPGTSPVLISTPTPGTNVFMPGLNVIPATATANTAAYLGVTTPTPGSQYDIYNASASTVRAKAAGGATINGATAGGYITIPTLAMAHCHYTSATNVACTPPVALTPQGP
jgi:hypothetical protein